MNKFKFNIFSLGLVAGSLLGATSCGDSFLDVTSKTESNTDNFYKTENDAWRALIGCYDGWRQVGSNTTLNFYMASTIMSDETYGATGNGDGRNYQVIDRFDQSQSPADLDLYKELWKISYAAVYRCNELITREDQIQWTEGSANRGLYIGEARAIRALMYFDMVRLWGNIPLFLEPVNANREQADPDAVYAAIVDDLKYAIANIPADANLGVDNSGRITKYAAEALLARVYLYYTGYYGHELNFAGSEEEGVPAASLTKAEALAAMEDVISSGNFQLVEDYKNLWPAASLVAIPGENGWDTAKSTYAGDANSEIIIQQKYTPTGDWNGRHDGNYWIIMVGMRGNLDKPPYGRGWGACTVCPTYLSKYESADTRLQASVIDLYGEGISENPEFNTSVKDWREFTGYCMKKYIPLRYGNGMVGGDPNGTSNMQLNNIQPLTIMRYADVLLMAAELGSGNAQSYFDQVRKRAGLASINVSHDNIMKERAVEFAFEGIRYWDLMRQANGGDVTALADALAASSGDVKNGGVAGRVEIMRQNVIDKKGLSQIPFEQLTLSNGMLVQNSGWSAK